MECRCIAIHKVGGMFGHPWACAALGLGINAICLTARCCLLQGVKYTLRATTSRYRWLAYPAEVSCRRWRVLCWSGSVNRGSPPPCRLPCLQVPVLLGAVASSLRVPVGGLVLAG